MCSITLAYLESLNISHCPLITDDAIQTLALSCPHLSHLRMEELTLLTDRSIAHPTRGLAINCRDLETLYVARCTHLTIESISALVRHCTHLCILDVSLIAAIAHAESADRSSALRQQFELISKKLAYRTCQFIRGYNMSDTLA